MLRLMTVLATLLVSSSFHLHGVATPLRAAPAITRSGQRPARAIAVPLDGSSAKPVDTGTFKVLYDGQCMVRARAHATAAEKY